MAVLTAWLRVRRLVAKTLPCGALAGTATPRVAPEDEEPPVRDPGPPTRPFTPCHLRVLGAAQGLVTVEWSMEDPSNDAQGDGDAQAGMEPDHSEGSEDREQERAGTEGTVRSKTRKLIRKVSKTLSVASTQSGEGAAARRPRYTHCQVKIDGMSLLNISCLAIGCARPRGPGSHCGNHASVRPDSTLTGLAHREGNGHHAALSDPVA